MNIINNRLYNIFVISSDEKLVESFDKIDKEICFSRKNNFDLDEILSNVDAKFPDALIIDLDNIESFSLENVILSIRNAHQLQHLPLIVFSENNDIETRIEILNQGVDDFIEKPIIIDEFLARIHNILRRCRKFSSEKIISVDDIKINVLSRKVEIRGKQIKISAKEFGILKLLAENCNKIFSRKDILNLVWNDKDGSKVNERTIDVHINRLRIALGADRSGESYIRTVRGEGYSLHIESYENKRIYSNRGLFQSNMSNFGFANKIYGGQYNGEIKVDQMNYRNEFDFVS